LRFTELLLSPRNSGSVTVSVTILDTDESHTCQMSGLRVSATYRSMVMPNTLCALWPFHFGKRTKNKAPQELVAVLIALRSPNFSSLQT
jgi:hypothetical protein